MIAPELDEYCASVRVQPAVLPNSDCPWCNNMTYISSSQTLCLHREILDFARWISPTEEEKLLRLIVIKRFRTAIKLLWPDASIVCHGSSATKTYLPGGDIDFVVINPPPNHSQPELLSILNSHLNSLQTFRKSDVLESARCPIIKGIEKPFGFHIDIAINNFNGILNIERNLNAMKKFPALLPLLYVLKFFLFQNRLDEPFRGGISTNTLQQMIIFVIQSSHETRRNDLGYLLTLFFQTFGIYFNYLTTGISTRFGGRLFSRLDMDRVNWKQPINICVEDPQIPGNFLGENAFESGTFRSRCYGAYNRLQRPSTGEQSLLLRVINRPDWIIKHRAELKKHINTLNGNSLNSIPLDIPTTESSSTTNNHYSNSTTTNNGSNSSNRYNYNYDNNTRNYNNGLNNISQAYAYNYYNQYMYNNAYNSVYNNTYNNEYDNNISKYNNAYNNSFYSNTNALDGYSFSSYNDERGTTDYRQYNRQQFGDVMNRESKNKRRPYRR
ncbi:PAP/25A associated domain containing protein [Tritrichomonas foetus]|uniref:PAP/25A associated domain containing protein n=1 Tax=Tritrichomonas foetus TaxID=1144522 RepID=A0A1J4J423_9EUKA|nr:PAP/25A associated domain containing protein [Tritrichomonas foetus]|eukprot:OHS94114.1 PAP/25A associated domain containing protein [Tritrichomonas foetus]